MSDELLREKTIEREEQTSEHEESVIEMVHAQFVEQRASTERGTERFDKALNALGGGIARLERKLDRILALVTEVRLRNR